MQRAIRKVEKSPGGHKVMQQATFINIIRIDIYELQQNYRIGMAGNKLQGRA